MVAKLKAGDIDGVSTSSRHFADAHDYLYSKPYFTVQKALIVADTNPKNIQSVQDLAGKRVGYQADNQFNKSLLDRYEGVIAVPMNSLSEVVDALIVGDIDATIEANIIYHVDKAKSPFMKTVALIPDSTLDLLFLLGLIIPKRFQLSIKGSLRFLVLLKWKLKIDGFLLKRR
ncbi:transporter substrate-binding domain-containing protein [Psychromonas sp. MME2]|uniref:transporter substrate-binding domain-containing protein n=1 Tax=Psychromonas sp. MME2 TaxID=3231033 RepID=UPI00339C4883